MAILHKNITASGDIHNPKWHPDANNGDYAWKNEKGELESIDELLLPAALNFVDGSVAPPTSNTNDIYILSSGASVNAGWGSVALQDWVKYDGAAWNAITPQKSSLCYDKNADSLMSFDGAAWAAIGGGGGGGNTIYSANDTVGTGRIATLTDTLRFKDGTFEIEGASTTTGTTLALYNGSGTPFKTWEWLDNGNLNINNVSYVTTFNFNNKFLTFDDIPVFDLDAKAEAAFVMRITAGNNSISNGARIELYETSVYSGYAKSLIFKARKNDGDIKHLADTSSKHGFYLNNGYSATTDFTTSNRRFEIGDSLSFFHNTSLAIAPNVTTTPTLLGSEDISLQGVTVIKGTGTTTGTTLALYDDDTTPNKNAEFKDNGNISFYNLPTSSSGLSSGDIYNDGGTLKIV